MMATPTIMRPVHHRCTTQVTTSILPYPVLHFQRFYMPESFILICNIQPSRYPPVQTTQWSSNSQVRFHHNIEQTTAKSCHTQDINWFITTRPSQPTSTTQHAANTTQISTQNHALTRPHHKDYPFSRPCQKDSPFLYKIIMHQQWLQQQSPTLFPSESFPQLIQHNWQHANTIYNSHEYQHTASPACQKKGTNIIQGMDWENTARISWHESHYPITQPTKWVSSLTYPHKSKGTLHICLNPQHLNKTIIREHNKVPAMDEIFHWLNRATTFSKLNARDVFCEYSS